MRRSLLLLLGIGAITYFNFFFYPGHTFLAGASQPLVAMMERLQAPGFLSRDLAATNPNLTYTIYDEVTLFLCRSTAHDFEWVLAAQQLVFRFAGILGVFLLCLSIRIGPLAAFGVTALASAGAIIPGIHMSMTDPEPIPFSFAFALTVLAFGLLASFKPLLAGLIGGIALAYQPTVAAGFWLFVMGMFVFRRDLRHLVRPTFPALIVFGLLLANAAQLQAGRGESHSYFQTISDDWLRLQLYRTPEWWVSTWSAGALLFYAAAAIPTCLALRYLWPGLRPLVRELFLFLIGLGLITLPATVIGAQVFRWAIISELQLTRGLSLFVLAAFLLWSGAASENRQRKQRVQALLWVSPFLACVLLFRIPLFASMQQSESRSIHKIAEWADRNTWGGSMFLFPDAGKSIAPGQFRGLAMRAVYSDWVSGSLVDVFPVFGAEWFLRWKKTGEPDYSVRLLREFLTLPVEYIVVRRGHALANVRPEIVTSDFVVYDAHLLQTAPQPFRQTQ